MTILPPHPAFARPSLGAGRGPTPLRTLLACLLGVLALASPGRAAGPVPDADFVPQTRQYVERLVPFGFAGVVMVAVEGVPVLAQGYGLADREHAVPWTPATVTTVGSITKQFTAAAILRLAEQGKLATTDPITRYFPGVPADKREITLRQLLTHSSGILDLEGADDWDPILREEFVRRALAAPLGFPPGTRFEYSNANYSLLGAIVEQLTDGSYETFLRRELFAPAGMFETGYILPAWGEQRLAQGYRDGKPWGTVLGRPMAPDGPYWVLRANGGIHSTAYDMLRWATALSSGRVLSPASLAELWTPWIDEGGGDDFYGYGWDVRQLPGGGRLVTHNGGNGIFFADYGIVPDAGIVAFVATNVVADFRAANRLLQEIGDRLFAGVAYPDVPVVTELPAAAHAALAGTYRAAGGETFEVTAAADGLLVTASDRRGYSLLNAPPDADLDRLLAESARVEKVAAGILRRDYQPLFEAYGGRTPLDELARTYDDRRAQAEAELGALQSFEVVGTAASEAGDETLIEYRFAGGVQRVSYLWKTGPDSGELRGARLGVSGREIRFRPQGEEHYVSWSPGRRFVVEMAFTRGQGGDLRLSVGATQAVRVAPPAE